VSLSPLNIVYTIASLQPSGGELDPARYRFVGPSISAGEREADEPDYAALPRPMIYVSFGTIMHEQPRLYQALVPRLEGLGASVVMSVGGRVDPASLGPVPSNFVIRARVSQLEVLRSADVFVTHGGMNSFHEALSLGVPMVSIPFHEEQRTVARQCAAHGCGVHVARPEAGAIAEAVREVLARPSYRERCARLSRELRESGGAAAAADSILAYAGADRRGRGGTDARVGP